MKFIINFLCVILLFVSIDPVFAVRPSSIFDNYTSWPRSMYQKSNDSTSWILEMMQINNTNTDISWKTLSYNWQSNWVTLTDINGDWLVDFIYSRHFPSNGRLGNVRMAVMINKGNFTFTSIYKCVFISEWNPLIIVNGNYFLPEYYYGDCADTTR